MINTNPSFRKQLPAVLFCLYLCCTPASVGAQAPEAAAGATDAGNTVDAAALAQQALDQGNVELALAIYSQNAFAGEIWAQLMLGQINLNGVLVPQSIASAVDWYVRAAVRGSAVAQYRLGLIFCDEENPQLSRPAKCLDWLTLSANNGFAPALHQLAMVAYLGKFGQGNYESARQLAAQASEAGISESAELLKLIAADDARFKKKTDKLDLESINKRFSRSTHTLRLAVFDNPFEMKRFSLNVDLPQVYTYQVGGLYIVAHHYYKGENEAMAAITALPDAVQALNPLPVAWQTIKDNMQQDTP